MSSGVSRTVLGNPGAERIRHGLAALSAGLRSGKLEPAGPETPCLQSLRSVLETAPRSAWPRLATAFNEDQVASKLWLAERLERVLDPSEHRVVILGAWYGVLVLILNQVTARPPAEVQCIDIDPDACELAKRLLSVLSPRPEVVHADMMEVDYEPSSSGKPTVLVNTSCEHLPDFAGFRERIPSGSRLVLQSNDHIGCPEHVNCVPDLDAFERQARLSHVDYRGTLPLKHFRRFMLIGRA